MTEDVNRSATWRAMARPQRSRTRGAHACDLAPGNRLGAFRLANVAGMNRFLCGDFISVRCLVTPASGGESSHANSAGEQTINSHAMNIMNITILQAARAALLALTLTFAPAGKAAEAESAVYKSADCTAEAGQRLIDAGRYEDAIRLFTCLVEAHPTAVEGYRGRIEAQLLLGRYSDALTDYGRVTAVVLPVHPDAANTILAGYSDRLGLAPNSRTALTGASFARWWLFDYASAIHLLNQLLDEYPDDLYGSLFRGSSRLLRGATRERGIADLERAIALAPKSADVRFIVADAYTYGQPDAERAFAEATLALKWGLDTPRVHAMLASAYLEFGDPDSAAIHFQRHLDIVTSELVPTIPLAPGSSFTLDLVPGRTYEIPLEARAGELISLATSSHDFWDTILVLLAPNGSPVLGSDDTNGYFAAFNWVPQVGGTYRVRVTSFEGISTGQLEVTSLKVPYAQ